MKKYTIIGLVAALMCAHSGVTVYDFTDYSQAFDDYTAALAEMEKSSDEALIDTVDEKLEKICDILDEFIKDPTYITKNTTEALRKGTIIGRKHLHNAFYKKWQKDLLNSYLIFSNPKKSKRNPFLIPSSFKKYSLVDPDIVKKILLLLKKAPFLINDKWTNAFKKSFPQMVELLADNPSLLNQTYINALIDGYKKASEPAEKGVKDQSFVENIFSLLINNVVLLDNTEWDNILFDSYNTAIKMVEQDKDNSSFLKSVFRLLGFMKKFHTDPKWTNAFFESYKAATKPTEEGVKTPIVAKEILWLLNNNKELMNADWNKVLFDTYQKSNECSQKNTNFYCRLSIHYILEKENSIGEEWNKVLFNSYKDAIESVEIMSNPSFMSSIFNLLEKNPGFLTSLDWSEPLCNGYKVFTSFNERERIKYPSYTEKTLYLLLRVPMIVDDKWNKALLDSYKNFQTIKKPEFGKGFSFQFDTKASSVHFAEDHILRLLTQRIDFIDKDWMESLLNSYEFFAQPFTSKSPLGEEKGIENPYNASKVINLVAERVEFLDDKWNKALLKSYKDFAQFMDKKVKEAKVIPSILNVLKKNPSLVDKDWNEALLESYKIFSESTERGMRDLGYASQILDVLKKKPSFMNED